MGATSLRSSCSPSCLPPVPLGKRCGQGSLTIREIPCYRKKSLTVGGNPLLNKESLTTERGSLTIIHTGKFYSNGFLHIVRYLQNGSSLKGFLHYFNPTKVLFIIPLSKDFFIIPVRLEICSFSLTGLIHYSISTKDSLLFLNTFLLFQSGKEFMIKPLSQELFIIPIR